MWKRWKRDYMYLTFDLWMSYQILQHSCVLLGHLGRATLSFSPPLSLSFSLFLFLCGIVLWKHAGTAGLIHRERSWSKVNEKSTTLFLSLPVFSALLSLIRPVSLSFYQSCICLFIFLVPLSFSPLLPCWPLNSVSVMSCDHCHVHDIRSVLLSWHNFYYLCLNAAVLINTLLTAAMPQGRKMSL